MKYRVIVLSLVLAISSLTFQPGGTVSATSVFNVGGAGSGNYSSVQDAIDAAVNGDWIKIYEGVYFENIVIDKELTVIGKKDVVIDGQKSTDTIYILADNVKLLDLTVTNSSGMGAGIVIEGNNVIVRRCTVTANYYGIYTSFDGGTLIHNMLYDNVHNAWDTGDNAWDDGSLGNQWGDYVSSGSDGIGTSPYVIPGIGNTDRFPLLYPYGPPVARCDLEVDKWDVQGDSSASFDYDGFIVDWIWNWGDGNSSFTKVASHTYAYNGTYTVSLTVTDDNGSMDTTAQQIYIDNTAPFTTVHPTPAQPNGLNGWYASTIWATLTSFDDASGVSSIKYHLDNQQWVTYETPIEISVNGQHTLTYYAVDNAGNKEKEQCWSVFIDRNTPTTLSDPLINESMWYTAKLSIELVSSDVTTEVSGTYYRLNSGTFIPYVGMFNITDQGINRLEYFSVDTAGNREALQQVNVRMDSVKPTAEIMMPQDAYLYLMGRPIFPLETFSVIIGDIDVEVTASDTASGIHKVEFYTDGTLQLTDRNAPYVWNWNEPAFGPYTIEVTAYDHAGNTASAEVAAIVINL